VHGGHAPCGELGKTGEATHPGEGQLIVSAFFIVWTAGPPEEYRKHWATFDQAVADFLRLFHEGEAEAIHLEFSS
jgi:hypothetical protein